MSSYRVDSLSPNIIRLSKGTVTQTTNSTTAVTLNKAAGVITTVSLSNAAAATTSFTLNNGFIKADSVVMACIESPSGTIGTNGYAVVTVSAVADGSCVLNVTNLAPSNALSGAVKIAYIIV